MSMEPEEEDLIQPPAPAFEEQVEQRAREIAAERAKRPAPRSTEGQKLAGGATTVILAGERYQFVLDNRAVVALEARWGSMMALGRELEKGTEGKVFTAITDVMTACVRGLPRGVEVTDLMQFSEYEAYGEAVLKGLEATGMYVPAENGRGNGAGPSERGRPNGHRSTTKRSSSSGSRQRRSGR